MFRIDEKRKKRINLAGTLLTFAAVTLALIAALRIGFDRTLGWFANNRNVDAQNMTAGFNGLNFDVAVKKIGQYPQTLIPDPAEELEASLESRETVAHILEPAADFLEEPENGGFTIADMTDNSHTALFCEFNNEYFTEDVEEGLSPGSYGWLSFDIVLKDDKPTDFLIDFSYLPMQSDRLPNGTRTIYLPDSEDIAVLDELLSGHILLFEERTPHTGGSNGYYYSRLIDGQLRVSAVPGDNCTLDADDGRYHYEVTVYWIWPLTFTHMAYLQEGNTDKLHTQPMFNNQNDLDEMLASIRSHPQKYFRFPSGSTVLSGGLAEGFQDEDGAYLVFCGAYNRADQIIGNGARYLAIIADVREAEPSATPEP